jgi:hypothetical protein
MTRTLALGALALTLGLASPIALAHDDNAAYFLLGAAVGSAVQQHGNHARRHDHVYPRHYQPYRWKAIKRHDRRHHARHHARPHGPACHQASDYRVQRHGYRQDFRQDFRRDYGAPDHRHYRDRDGRRYR